MLVIVGIVSCLICVILYKLSYSCVEYNRLMAEESASDRIQSNLLSIAPKIISVAKSRNLAAKEAQALLVLYDKGADEDEVILSEGMYVKCKKIN